MGCGGRWAAVGRGLGERAACCEIAVVKHVLGEKRVIVSCVATAISGGKGPPLGRHFRVKVGATTQPFFDDGENFFAFRAGEW